jgi:hypothetical protein
VLFLEKGLPAVTKFCNRVLLGNQLKEEEVYEGLTLTSKDLGNPLPLIIVTHILETLPAAYCHSNQLLNFLSKLKIIPTNLEPYIQVLRKFSENSYRF